MIAKDLNHLDPDNEDRKNRDPCISDPGKIRKSIEKNGYRFEKKIIENTRDVEYVLIFKSTDLRTSPQVKTDFYYLYFLSPWKDADPAFAEAKDAKKRLAGLTGE